MFAFLKKFSKKSEPAAPLAPLVPVAEPPPVFAPVAVAEPEYQPAPVQRPAPAPRQVTPRVPSAPAFQPVPRSVTPVPAAPAPVPSPVRVPSTARQAPSAATPVYEFPAQHMAASSAAPIVADELLELPLKKLWHKLSPAIVQAATEPPHADSMLQLPLSYLHSQLAKGTVKIPFPEFCNFAPVEIFASTTGHDAIEVEIPISAILPLLKPEHLGRRPNQRRIQVPDDIEPIFGPDGGPVNGLRISDTKSNGKKSTSPASIAPVAPAVAQAPAPVVPQPPAPVTPIPPAAPISPIAPAPSLPIPEKIVARNLPPVPSRTPITPIAPAEIPITPISPIANTPGDMAEPTFGDRIPAPRLDPSLASFKPKAAPAAAPRTPTPVPAPVPPIPSPVVPNTVAKSSDTDVFTIALMDVSAFWSEKGRNDLANLYRHSLEIPMNTLETALKSGKLSFQWREVRPWLRLAPGNSMPTFQDDLIIDLPLAVVASRFVEQRFQGKTKRRVEVGDDIPDVFEQKTPAPGAQPAPAVTTPPLGATAVAMDLAPSLGASSPTGDTAFLTRTGGKTLLEFGEIFGQPEKKDWTLSEVAQKAMTLRGVAGAIIASGDGLLVAGTWPNGVKGDAVSAFLPQLYGRILQYTKELKLGEPGHVTLMIENVPLQIFKAGTSFFTVLGRAGENLPKAQLNAIATRLSTNFSGK